MHHLNRPLLIAQREHLHLHRVKLRTTAHRRQPRWRLPLDRDFVAGSVQQLIVSIPYLHIQVQRRVVVPGLHSARQVAEDQRTRDLFELIVQQLSLLLVNLIAHGDTQHDADQQHAEQQTALEAAF